MSRKSSKKYVSEKGRLPTFCGPKSWQTTFFLCIFDLNYCKGMFASFWLNFSQKLANVPPGQNVGKHTPPKSGGLNISWGKKRLRQSTDELSNMIFMNFKRICDFHIFWTLFWKKTNKKRLRHSIDELQQMFFICF